MNNYEENMTTIREVFQSCFFGMLLLVMIGFVIGGCSGPPSSSPSPVPPPPDDTKVPYDILPGVHTDRMSSVGAVISRDAIVLPNNGKILLRDGTLYVCIDPKGCAINNEVLTEGKIAVYYKKGQ